MNEAQAISLCIKHRDPIGFEYLVKKYRKEALFHARIFLGNTEDAADACQESFSRAFRAFPKLKSLNSFYPWFYQILKNCCLNMIKKLNTSAKYKMYKHQQSDNNEPDSADPFLQLEKGEEVKLIWRVLQELRPEFKEILIMKYLNEFSYNTISEFLHIPRGTVMSRLYYARKAFKDKYYELVKDPTTEEVVNE